MPPKKKKEDDAGNPFQELCFITKYVISYRNKEIKSFDGVIESLRRVYEDAVAKKKQAEEELGRVVAEKLKEWSSFEVSCEQQQHELYTLLRKTQENALNIRQKGEKEIRACEMQLQKAVDLREERREVMRTRKLYMSTGQHELRAEMENLQEKINRTKQEFEKDQGLLSNIWEKARLKYIKNEKEDLSKIRQNRLDTGIDGLSNDEWLVLKERARLRTELDYQIETINDLRQELQELESTKMKYEEKLEKLQEIFYKLIHLPDWATKACLREYDSKFGFLSHEEDDLLPDEPRFNVPFTMEMVCVNYSPLSEIASRPNFYTGSSLYEERGGILPEAFKPSWNFDKRIAIKLAHGDEKILKNTSSHGIEPQLWNFILDQAINLLDHPTGLFNTCQYG